MNLTIRPIEVSDAENMITYLNQIAGESENLTFGLGEFAITLEKEISYLESLQGNGNQMMVVATVDDEIVGNISYNGGHRLRTRHVGEFGISVRKDYWGKGIGKALLQNLIDWAKASPYCEKINLRVRDDNIRAIGLYRKLGFQVEGLIKRDMKINGEFVDCLFMGLKIEK
ncbi:MAG: GNAT family N-acetyltransferase [Clostridiales bacterium]|nr:GNAT family N-acetyltransferase [Clostridiales bacterium]